MLAKAQSLQIERQERDVFSFYIQQVFLPPQHSPMGQNLTHRHRNHKFTALKYTKIPLKLSGITVPHRVLNGQARSYDITLRL